MIKTLHEGFSPFFTFEELTDSSKYPELVPKNRTDAVPFLPAGRKLSALMAEIRVLLGNKRVIVSSGFRGETLNIKVGGVDKVVNGRKVLSSHRRFEAVDVTHSTLTPKEAFNLIMRAHKEGKLPNLRKCILESVKGKTWLHIEVSVTKGDFKGFMTTKNGTSYQAVTSELA